ncbi:hypothetical protein ASC94_01055 [Massilia sp. Root418]|uniref:hypothetical protein n=1 Tax=Massilia sp. Root418 TaxID=1736532 RepID=UPI0006FBF47E|nr:hypothetical protein [Massilia sp. Root418]KQX01266.1 hypothetical protein ASC94_01055 [Massilia sp. Root418]
MCRTPTVRQLCLLLAAGWLATGAQSAGAAAMSAAGIGTIPASRSAPAASGTAGAAAAPAAAAAPFEALAPAEPQLLAAANNISQAYLTPANFSRAQAGDANASLLHLPRQDADLDAIDPYKRHPTSADDGLNPTVLWLSALGLVTAAVSGVLQYARNPITRKRKYRNYDRPAP